MLHGRISAPGTESLLALLLLLIAKITFLKCVNFRYFQRMCWCYSCEARFFKEREKLNLNGHESLLKENADSKKIHLCFRSLSLFTYWYFVRVVNFSFFEIAKYNLKIICFSRFQYFRHTARKIVGRAVARTLIITGAGQDPGGVWAATKPLRFPWKRYSSLRQSCHPYFTLFLEYLRIYLSNAPFCHLSISA